MPSLKPRIRITNFCTNNCWYCSMKNERNNIEMGEYIMKSIIYKLRTIYDNGNFNRVKFSITGGNPFLTDFILKTSETIYNNFKGIETHIVSDVCLNSNPDILKKYTNIGGLCLVSLNEDSINKILDLIKDIPHRNIFLFNVLLTKYNVKRIDDIINTVIKYKLPIRFDHLFDPENKHISIDEMIICINYAYEKLNKSDFKYTKYNYPFGCLHLMKNKASSYCGYGEDHYFIDVLGNFRRCQNEKNIGNFLYDNAEKLIKKKIEYDKECLKCKYFKICKGGCPYTNSLHKYCRLYKAVCQNMEKMEYREVNI